MRDHFRSGHGFGHPSDRGEDHGCRHKREELGDTARGAPACGHGFGRGRGSMLGRLFAHGNLHLAALYLIAEKPRHGYEIIKVIEEMAGGSYAPSPGTIYPALSMLEDQGYVTVALSDGSKKLYTVTDEGKTYLDANRPAVEALLARIKQAAAAQGGEPAPQIVRAMENLKLALRMKLSGAPLSAEQAQSVATALDQAVAVIERT
ncbi:MAG: PadR family transcriptional regulator [Rhizomicrobium sp.]